MTLPLPMINGVSASCVWLPHGDWPSYADFFAQRFPDVTMQTWQQRANKQQLVDEFGVPIVLAAAYCGGRRAYYYRELDNETPIPFFEQILYQDEHLVVVDKPHFLPVIPSGQFLQQTLLVRLKKTLACEDLIPIHRIDRETAGIVLFSRNVQTRGAYQNLFKNREVSKTYHALAPSRDDLDLPLNYQSRMVEGEPFFRMQEVAGIANSQTHIECLACFGELSLYKLQPVTGRKHQLRVHLAALGIPIVNDSFYPHLQADQKDDFTRPLKLLAKSIAFIDPITKQPRYFESQIEFNRAC
jgi:tRNA pseudouridine32 synthase/23S rRNA pseudouridine746 synthase